LFKISEQKEKSGFWRIFPLGMMMPDDWEWRELSNPPFLLSKIQEFCGDNLGNL